MRTIDVTIRSLQSTVETSQSFRSSPVRIGRSELNDLVLPDPLVSEWHAVLSYDATTVTLVDLGSTNGTAIDGASARPHTSQPLAQGSRIAIGSNLLSFRPRAPDRSEATVDGQRHRSATPLSPSPASSAGDGADSASPDTSDPARLALRIADELGPGIARYRESAASLSAHLDRALGTVARPLRDSVRGALMALHNDLQCLDAARCPVDASNMSVPEATDRTPKAPHNSSSAPCSPPAIPWRPTPAEDECQTRIVPPSAANDPKNRLRDAALETLFQAFVELRRCQKQQCDELGLGWLGSSPFDHAATSQSLIASLASDHAGQGDSILALTQACANQVAHQIGILSGVIAGGRALLRRLSPDAQKPAGYAIAQLGSARRPRIGWWTSLIPVPSTFRWNAYVEQHAALAHEDRFVSELFGPSFSQAYHAVVGSSGERGRDQRDPDGATIVRSANDRPAATRIRFS